ncbi:MULTISPECIES: BON domain-containing protein [unclassified Curtobacterium]|uniref:BON domain-containing protein n=1 Tax=unclassified Curtobacterium TaxID=257496 RepID=UPI003A8105A2
MTDHSLHHRPDDDVKADVEEELDWTPGVDAAGVGVAVEDGVVTLTGQVGSHTERVQAARAVLRVTGVRGLAEELDVRGPSVHTDADIASAVRAALDADASVPSDTIDVQVRDRIVTLSGSTHWYFQRLAAVRDAERVGGAQFVLDRLELSPRPSAPDTAERIRAAFIRNAALDADRIGVAVAGTTVTLTGTARSWAERRQAEIAAWRSPHVTAVEDHVAVDA